MFQIPNLAAGGCMLLFLPVPVGGLVLVYHENALSR